MSELKEGSRTAGRERDRDTIIKTNTKCAGLFQQASWLPTPQHVGEVLLDEPLRASVPLSGGELDHRLQPRQLEHRTHAEHTQNVREPTDQTLGCSVTNQGPPVRAV